MFVHPEIQKTKDFEAREPESNRALFEKFGMRAKREHPDGTDPYQFSDPNNETHSTLQDLASGADIARVGELTARSEAAKKAAEEAAKKAEGEDAVKRLKAMEEAAEKASKDESGK